MDVSVAAVISLLLRVWALFWRFAGRHPV